jgi:integrase
MAIGKLSAAKVKTAGPGMHGDGGGLWLQVGAGKSWSFRFTSPATGKARQMGLGSLDAVPLARARDLAADARSKVTAGVDPIAEREAAREAAAVEKAVATTFATAAERYIAAHKAGWRNAKHAAQWQATLATHANPHIGNKAVAAVDVAGVLAVLEPLWKAGKIETGVRVRGRIEAVLDYAAVQGWRPKGFNPAMWKGNLAHTLASPRKARPVQHHAALPWQDMPGFMAELGMRDGRGVLALRLAILTAARSGEVRGAIWSEIDLDGGLWTVPAGRMKAGREHRVPLSPAALGLLREAALLRPEGEEGQHAQVFPGLKAGIPLSDMSLSAVLRRMGRGDLTVHGFRSTFRDWVAEATTFPAEVAEAALAHTLPNKVQAAYQRGDLLERRRKLMADWAAFCCSAGAGDQIDNPQSRETSELA